MQGRELPMRIGSLEAGRRSAERAVLWRRLELRPARGGLVIRSIQLSAAALLIGASTAHAETHVVDPSAGPLFDITSALAATSPGDSVEVPAGTFDECDLLVPDGVTLYGAGVTTEIHATACPYPAAITLGDGASLADVVVLPPDDLMDGIELESDADLLRVSVLGGSTCIHSYNGSATVNLESVLIVGGPDTGAGMELNGGTVSLERVTLAGFNTSGSDVAIEGGNADLSITDSIVYGWAVGVGSWSTCRIRGSIGYANGIGNDWTGCDEDAHHTNRLVDPLFVDPTGVDGDFHLQSPAGSWSDLAPNIYGAISPGLDAGLYTSAAALAEGDPETCNMPNLGAYGGTDRASRRPATFVCPVNNTTSGAEFPSLGEAASAAQAGDTIELAEGIHGLTSTATFLVDATLQPSPSSSPTVRSASDWGNFPLLHIATADQDTPFAISGIQIGSPGHNVVAIETSGALNLSLSEVTTHGEAAVDTEGSDVDQTIVVTDSVLGTLEDPMLQPIISVNGSYQSSTAHTVTVTITDTQVVGSTGLVQLAADLQNNDDRVVNITGSEVRVGGLVVQENTSMWGAGNTLTLDLTGNVIFSADVVELSTLAEEHELTFQNNLFASWSTSAPILDLHFNEWSSSTGSLHIVNNTFVGGGHAIEFELEAAADEVRNNVFVGQHDTVLQVVSGNTDFDPAAVHFNLFDADPDASNFQSQLPSDNIQDCDPGFPQELSTSSFDVTFAAVDWIPPAVSCLTDAGDPDPSYDDAAGGTNDLGASGGPWGDLLPVIPDNDSDGFQADVDCDDGDDAIYPGATDTCGDSVDSDCAGGDGPDGDGDGEEGGACGTDCNDADASINHGELDLACDGYDQDCSGADEILDQDGDGYWCDVDCGDEDIDFYPGAPEVCDGEDTDCDGVTPEAELDGDADGFSECEGDCDPLQSWTNPSAPESCDGLDNNCDNALPVDEQDLDGDLQFACLSDCDDTDPEVYWGAQELCDGIVNDCDPAVDLDLSLDTDGDSFGSCDPDPALRDCDDNNIDAHPGGVEVCDAVPADNDCDGVYFPDEHDFDGDGESECAGDCNDYSAAMNSGEEEVCDGLDNDCDGVVADEEVDGDADNYVLCTDWVGDPATSSGDCSPSDATIYPGAPEICDGNDNDCLLGVPADEDDADGDGWLLCGDVDCNDANDTIYPGAEEVCNGEDDDCDGDTDEDLDADGDGFLPTGSCPDGLDCDDDDPAVNPDALEACDGVDTDCDGVTDSNELDADGDGFRGCEGDCDDLEDEINPDADEVCDDADNDCDGETNEELSFDVDLDGYNSEDSCADPVDCDDADPDVHPDVAEVCDGVDTDCDGDLPADEVDADDDGESICEGDCDDLLEGVHSQAVELCDGLDTDCDGEELGGQEDGDGDGWFNCDDDLTRRDCDDEEPLTHPGVEVDVCDGTDDDCDGVVDDEDDEDEDGFSPCTAQADCDEGDEDVYPGAPESCESGVDADCDRVVPAPCPTAVPAPGFAISCSAAGRSHPLGLLLLLPLFARRRR
jgi:hypothetical protein